LKINPGNFRLLQNSFEKWELLREASFVLKENEDQLRSVSGVARKTMADKVSSLDLA